MPLLQSMDHADILATALAGMANLLAWAKSEGSLHSVASNGAFEACRCELALDGSGTFDDVVQLYKSPNDAAAALHHVHVDKSQALYTFTSSCHDIALRWGVFKAPFPFMRDRSATYIKYTKEFTNANGLRGFARLIKSHTLGRVDHANYVRANIRSWGVVVVETADPNVLHVSSTVDIDWHGNTPAWVATLMTSRRTQSIKALATVLRLSKKTATKHCSVCTNKSRAFNRFSQLVPCTDCTKPVCSTCRSMPNRGETCCWGCVKNKVVVRRLSTAGLTRRLDASTQSPETKLGWYTPKHIPNVDESMYTQSIEV
ncbi:hypothetical protein SPRG_10156 [Saprolegnia parasitica CBS 223.65]|uniref:START domain-containing protein n=1 Tax=Saprolegnia parasitica (strain CBS 223.65) TaxID=695850 RepID=A0A067C1H8_SAPPC|nr:hypothetical protein SPRG_10156 [Saprolegnia parasitica CBS 223.65]KDO24624.1 hypothetical protein SPRG_10156 [Saprolegnia parasitica CBS 223.65]|eukprot:XP_012204692.1 hypothetical protein SPRG_10156 [Saprolegnia parasitica CBS 223.65]